MATNFPGSQDSFTNPTSSDTLASPDHAAQHTNVNDAVEAIELALLDGAPLHIDDTNERVGIGTTSPTSPLHIKADSFDMLALDRTDNANIDQQVILAPSWSGAGNTAFAIKIGSEIMRVTEAGNVGIGTTSPARSPLHLHTPSTAATELHLTNTESGSTSGDGLTIFYDDVTNGAGIWMREAGPLRLATSSSEKMRIAANGNVGIGTASPDVLLHVGDASTTGSLRVYNSTGAEGFRVLSTLVRSTSIYNATVANAANVYISSAGTMYRSTSSAKYKTDIETLDAEHADIIFELRPVWYRSTTGNDPEGWSYYGLIAEEVAELDPRLVHFGAAADCRCVEDNDGHIEHELSCLTEPEGVQYDRLVPHLISVVQRQQAVIDALEARIAALEA